jgi:DNA-binding transcriptional regulator YhcF (GntR family)
MAKQHNSKTIAKVFKELERLGFNVEKKKSGSYIIVPPNPQMKRYSTHGTESAYHPMRRDFKKLYDIDISQLV